MVNYECPRCGYNTNIKTKYIQHLKRKYICEPTKNNNNLFEEYKKYNISTSGESSVNPCESPQNLHNIYQKSTIYQQKINNKSTINLQSSGTKENICKYCEKKFSSYRSVWRHLKTCKEKKKDEEEKENLLKLVDMLNQQLKEQRTEFKEELSKRDKELSKRDRELSKRDRQIDELIKKAGMTIGTQNIQSQVNQEIKILAYKDTDLSHLTDKDYLKCIKHSNFCVPNLIEKIHFNPKKPENHNIYISNLKNNYAMIYNGSKWMICDREDSIQSLIDQNEGILEQKIEEWLENGNEYPEIMKKFNRYIEKKEDDRVLNKVKNEIRLMLFNNRDMISSK